MIGRVVIGVAVVDGFGRDIRVRLSGNGRDGRGFYRCGLVWLSWLGGDRYGTVGLGGVGLSRWGLATLGRFW